MFSWGLVIDWSSSNHRHIFVLGSSGVFNRFHPSSTCSGSPYHVLSAVHRLCWALVLCLVGFIFHLHGLVFIMKFLTSVMFYYLTVHRNTRKVKFKASGITFRFTFENLENSDLRTSLYDTKKDLKYPIENYLYINSTLSDKPTFTNQMPLHAWFLMINNIDLCHQGKCYIYKTLLSQLFMNVR